MSFDVSPLVDLHYGPAKRETRKGRDLSLAPVSFANRTVARFCNPVFLGKTFRSLVSNFQIIPFEDRGTKDKIKFNQFPPNL